MSDKKLRELEKQLKQEPGNLALRLQLAALYHAAGRTGDAVAQYRAVALAYRDDGRIQQAVAVARSGLAVAPDAELRRIVDAGTAQAAEGSGRAAARVLDTAVAVRELEPMRPARGSGPVEPVTGRTPSGTYTPTPLPVPLAYHDADPSKVHGMRTLAEDDDGEGGDTMPEGPTSGLSSAARRISEQLIAMSPPLPAPLEGDDLSSELETRRRPKIDPRALDHLGIPPTGQMAKLEPEPEPDDEPTNPPASEPGFEPGRLRRTVGRLDDDAWTEEPTDPRTDFDADRPPSGVFDRPLGVTVAALAPDGSPLTAPGGFTALPEVVRQRLIGAGEVRTVAAGTLIVREGEPGESLFVLEAGEVRVLKRFGGRPSSEVARLGAGAIVGEIAVMTDRRRHATVESIGEVRIVEIGRAAIASAAADHPVLAELLDGMVRERLLSNLMAVAPFFASLASDRRPDVLARFRPRKLAAGAAVIEQGTARTGLVLVLLGGLDVSVRRADGRSVRVATIGEGGHVGELALMSDDPEPATITAIGPTEVVVLPAREFYQVVADDPSLWTALRAEAQRRTSEIAAARA